MAGSDVVGLAQTGTGKTAAFAIPILSKIDTTSQDHAGAGAGADPRAGVAGRRGVQPVRRASAGERAADLRRLLVRPAAGRAQAWRAGRRRHAGPRHRPPREGHPRPHATSTTWCSTRPTRCSRWASPRTSNASWPTPPSTSRSRCSPRPCRLPSARSPPSTCTTRSRSRSSRKPQTAENISQRYIQVAGPRKMDALTRVLEVEPFEAMIVFVRTKQATEEVAERLQGAGVLRAGHQRRHPAGRARAHHRRAQGRKARHPDRHRRGGPRARRRAHLARAELRHPARPRVLRAPHRPHRPRRADPARRCCSSRRASATCSTRSSG